MSEPVVFISHFGIKEGKLTDVRRLTEEVIENLREDKPRTVLYLHFEGADERAKAAYQYLEPRGWEIYGRPSEAALESMRQAATGTGVPLTVLPDHLGGFLRLQPA